MIHLVGPPLCCVDDGSKSKGMAEERKVEEGIPEEPSEEWEVGQV